VQDIIHSTIDVFGIHESRLCIGEDQMKNLMHGIFEGYYNHIEKPVIFDTCRYWTSKTSLLKKVFPYTKIICTVRDITSILNSFELIFSKNPFNINLITDKLDFLRRCEGLMDRDTGIVYFAWVSLREGHLLNPDMIHFVEYESLCKEPEKTMRGVYEFLEKPYYSHDFENVEYSNENYDAGLNLKDLHTVRKKVEYEPQRNILPPELIDKYEKMNMEFWKKSDFSLNKKFINYE
jgi:sulfotransferase